MILTSREAAGDCRAADFHRNRPDQGQFTTHQGRFFKSARRYSVDNASLETAAPPDSSTYALALLGVLALELSIWRRSRRRSAA